MGSLHEVLKKSGMQSVRRSEASQKSSIWFPRAEDEVGGFMWMLREAESSRSAKWHGADSNGTRNVDTTMPAGAGV